MRSLPSTSRPVVANLNPISFDRKVKTPCEDSLYCEGRCASRCTHCFISCWFSSCDTESQGVEGLKSFVQTVGCVCQFAYLIITRSCYAAVGSKQYGWESNNGRSPIALQGLNIQWVVLTSDGSSGPDL